MTSYSKALSSSRRARSRPASLETRRKDRNWRRTLLIALLLFGALTAFGTVRAESPISSESQKIETLIARVGALAHAQFVRNGSTYSSANAATFLRRKWQANESKIKTARDFIENVASFSGTSGKPYLIRFDGGKEVRSHDYLIAELKKIESSATPAGG